MPLEDIVNVEITVATVTVAQQGFGTPLVLGPAPFTDRVREYSASTWQAELVADMVTGGMTEAAALASTTYGAVRAIMMQNPKPKSVKVGRSDLTAASIATDLDAIWGEDPDWYGLTMASSTADNIAAVAGWAETHPVIFAAQTDQASVLDSGATDDVISTLEALSLARTTVLYHSKPAEYAGAAWLSTRLIGEPGDATWKYATLRGVTPDKLTTSQQRAITDKHGNHYTTIAGRSIVIEGWATDGSFLDLTQLSDWTVARIKESVFATLSGNRKLPFSDAGGRQLYGAIWNAISPAMDGRRYLKYDGNPETHRVVVPAVADVPEADRAARRWSGIEFSFRAAGAVHSVGTIRGTITV
jgi:hypothetical protein